MSAWEYAIPGWGIYAGGRDVYRGLSGDKEAGMGIGEAWKGASDWWNKKNAPQIAQNPQLGNWNTLIGQLQRTASGQGPSVAAGAYSQAHGQAIKDQKHMAAGGSAGQQRQAILNIGRTNQGFQQGYANARLQEQLAAQQALQGALAGAGNAWFQPQLANLQATMGTQSNGQQAMNFLQQIAQFGAMAAGGKKPA